jgi:hypothetical protein
MYLGVVFLEGRWILSTSKLARASWACFLELSRDAFCDGMENLCYCAIENWVAVKKGRPKPSLTGPVRPVCRQFQ